jgi:hypothetical protein
MSLALVAVLLFAFTVCSWSGRTLARHYQDPLEVAAVLAVAACVVVSLVLTTGARDAGDRWSSIALAFAMSGGLFAGYLRSGPLR